MWCGDLLARKGLEIFDGMIGGMVEEFSDNAEAFVVGYVGGGFVTAWFTVQILEQISTALRFTRS